MSTATAAPAVTPFTFDKDYDNIDQVMPFYDAYYDVYAELDRADRYPYNASFKGKIAGLVAATDSDEDSAIYLLQWVRHTEDDHNRYDAYLADGYTHLTAMKPGTTVRGDVVIAHRANEGNRSEFYEFTTVPAARIVATEDGTPRFVFPKGKRNRGHDVTSARDVLIRTA